MKNSIKYICLVVCVMLLSACEDKVNVALDTAPPKLVVDASIVWQKGTAGNDQTIKLTTTTDYYATSVPVVSGATVVVTNDANVSFSFVEDPNTGNYICHNFVPVINQNYTLTILYKDATYSATDKLYVTPTIDSVEQTTVQGFTGDQIQVKFFFQDNGAENNFYLIGVKNSTLAIPDYGVIKDEFFQGNQMFGFYSDKDLKPGNQLFFGLEGISERYYNYMEKLLNIAGSSGGSPFSTPPATLRGNIINQTNSDDYPLGYFHLSEIDTRSYTVE